MLPRITVDLMPQKMGDESPDALLRISFDNKVVSQKLVTMPDGMLQGSYPDVIKALRNAEDSALHILSESLQAQLYATIEAIEVKLPGEYKRVLELKENPTDESI